MIKLRQLDLIIFLGPSQLNCSKNMKNRRGRKWCEERNTTSSELLSIFTLFNHIINRQLLHVFYTSNFFQSFTAYKSISIFLAMTLLQLQIQSSLYYKNTIQHPLKLHYTTTTSVSSMDSKITMLYQHQQLQMHWFQPIT